MDKKWYAIYTKPRWEKKVAAGLDEKGIENYLPLIKTLKTWSDRKKWVQEPLFRSYIFVHIDVADYIPALQTPGALKYVSFEKKAVSIPPLQIEAVKIFIESGEDLLSDIPELRTGDRVLVTRGALKGLVGTLVEFQQKHRVRIMIDGIQQSLHLNLPLSHLKPINS
jgi:transcription antitermination factor NusG